MLRDFKHQRRVLYGEEFPLIMNKLIPSECPLIVWCCHGLSIQHIFSAERNCLLYLQCNEICLWLRYCSTAGPDNCTLLQNLSHGWTLIWMFLPLWDILLLTIFCGPFSCCSEPWWSSSGCQHQTIVRAHRNFIKAVHILNIFDFSIPAQQHRDPIFQSHA